MRSFDQGKRCGGRNPMDKVGCKTLGWVVCSGGERRTPRRCWRGRSEASVPMCLREDICLLDT